MAPDYRTLLHDRAQLERKVSELQASVTRERARADHAERALQLLREHHRVAWQSWSGTILRRRESR